MSQYTELIKSFDKIRDYMRDFTVYGFKRRGDYSYKSARTYDNERRRIASWLGDCVRWDYSEKGKRVYLCVDSAHTAQNPLYAAWKSKSFTKSDIALHFYMLDLLSGGAYTAGEFADALSQRRGVVFDVQAVRAKLREYAEQGLCEAARQGRRLTYTLSGCCLKSLACSRALLQAVQFFQGAAPFGFVGSTITDACQMGNTLFRFKHSFMVHTLEDGILYGILCAMHAKREILLEIRSRRGGKNALLCGVALRILQSAQTGRRFVCLYQTARRRFTCVRLDAVLRLAAGDVWAGYDAIREKLAQNLPHCWGVSFGGRTSQHYEEIHIKLSIDEQRESYVLSRLRREGRGGEILRVEENVFLYSIRVFDSNEMLPFIKSFTGRILSLEGTNRAVVAKFHHDIGRMAALYASCADADPSPGHPPAP